ncbi:DUF2213 domain-containing protein [Roseicella aquatilis]|uniref:DUF2213 domain-containing protein n=1 Tax=Roseicella aquatilis TaxID=2527868 RepID=UPI001404D93C|nr:DUF2213 domain-containing protein [Roseicella aquatilis]
MLLHDRASLPSGMRLTGQGFAVGTALACRTGVMVYGSDELGLPGPRREIRLYRPRETVMSKASMASLAHKPVVSDHPPEGSINASNYRQRACGWVGGDVAVEGEHLRIPLCIADAATVREIIGGKREVSCGYRATVSYTPGVTPKGEAYDGVVTAITYDHVAIVHRGRAGSARLGDARQSLGEKAMSDTTIRIGDADIPADPRIVAEIERLRQAAAARSSLSVADQLRADARDALLADQAARRDPSTARGAYIAHLETAYRGVEAGNV